jgi:hypothetical protein
MLAVQRSAGNLAATSLLRRRGLLRQPPASPQAAPAAQTAEDAVAYLRGMASYVEDVRVAIGLIPPQERRRSLDNFNQERIGRFMQQAEHRRYAANLASWIEASPMGSAALAGTTAFQQEDVAAGARYEAELEAFLDDLLTRLPGLRLPAAKREQINGRLDVALRRAFVTVRAGPAGSWSTTTSSCSDGTPARALPRARRSNAAGRGTRS